MFASFHSNGTIPYSNDKLNTVASGMLICSTISNSNLGGIPSTPGDLLSVLAGTRIQLSDLTGESGGSLLPDSRF